MKKLLLLLSIISCGFSLCAQGYNQITTNSCVSSGVDTLYTSLTQAIPPSADATLTFYYQGDLDGGTSGNEYFTLIDENNNVVGISNCTGDCTTSGGQCLSTQDSVKFTIPLATLSTWTQDGIIDFKIARASGISQTLCTNPGSCAQIKLEYISVSGPDDAGVVSTTNATMAAVCPGSFPIEVIVKNFGTNQINSLTLNWEVDGVAQPSVAYSSLLDTLNGTGNNTDTVTLGNFTFNPAQVYNLMVWTSNPNGNPDTTNFNDTLNTPLSLNSTPTALTSSNVTSSSADVAWNAVGGTSFEIIYGPSGFDPATGGLTATSTGSSTTLSGLTAATSYEFYVLADCGAGVYSDTAGPAAFNTLCLNISTITLPFYENFEGASGTFVGNKVGAYCTSLVQWNFETDVQTHGRLSFDLGYSNTTIGATDVTAASLDEVNTGSEQPVNALIGTLDMSAYDTSNTNYILLSFFHLDHGDEGQAGDFVWVRGSIGDTWIQVYDLEANSVNGQWTEADNIDLGTILKTNNQNFSSSFQMKFGQEDNTDITSMSGIDGRSFDDVTIEEVSCLEIQTVNISNVTFNQAAISLLDPTDTFDIMWGPCGFTQGSPGVGTIIGAIGDTVLTNLFQSTCYDVYVRRDCGADGLSNYSGPFSFTTGCFITAPYVEDFENGFSAGSTGSNISNCLKSVNSTDPNWEVENSTGANENSLNTGPHYDNTLYGTAGGYYLYLETSGGATGEADTLYTAFMDVSSLNTPYFSFAYHMYGADMGDLEVEVLNGTNWNPIVTISGQQQSAGNDPFLIFGDSLTNLSSDTIKFRFIGVKGSGLTSDMAIDDIRLIETPSCFPSMLLTVNEDSTTGNSAFISWTPGTGLKYEVEWGLAGYTPGVGQIGSVTVTDTFYTISGLASQTAYDVYVRDSCSSSYSIYEGPASFTTLCAALSAISLPMNEDFESYTGPISVDGPFYCGTSYSWSVERPGNSGDVLFNYTGASGPTPPYNGMQSAGLQSLSSSDPIYLILTVNLSNYVSSGSGIRLSFFYADHLDEASAGDRVWARGSKFDLWIEIFDWSTVNSSNWEEAIISLDGILTANNQSLSSSTQIRWGQQDNATISGGDGFGLDDVSLIEITCPNLTGLAGVNLTDTSATLDWNGNSNATNYQVWYGPQGFYQGTMTLTGTKVFTTDDSLNLGGLTSLDCYEFLVRSICGPGDTTDWIGPVSFCTKCPNIVPMVLPYFDGFETYSGPVSQTGTFYCGPSFSWSVENPGGSGDVLFSYSALGGPSTPYNGNQSAGLQSLSSADPIYLIFAADMSNYTSAGTQVLLSFYFADHLDETGAEDKVWARGSSGDPWIEILDWNAIDATTAWQKFDIRLDSVFNANSQSFSSNTQIRWGQQDNATLTGNDGFSVDDLFIDASTCPAPSNLTASNVTTNSVDLSWTSGGASNVLIEYGSPGFIPGTGQFASATGSSHTLGGLTPGTLYELYIRDSCGAGDVSFLEGPVLFKTNCASALSGTYTIGATGNFATFDSVATVLNNCGVSGPVIFNIQSGTYVDKLHLTGLSGFYAGVPGVSATNTITFNGSGSDTLIWNGNGPQATVLLDSTGHVTLNNMTIVNNFSSEAWGILVTNHSDSVTVNGCAILMDSTSTSSDRTGILISGAYDNDLIAGAETDYLTIVNSTIVGGYYGIALQGNSSTDLSMGHVITGNIIKDYYYYGIDLDDIQDVEVMDNHITASANASTGADGIYTNDINDFKFEGNYIYTPDYGIYILDGNDGFTPTAFSTVINNMVISTDDYGIYLNDAIKIDVYHNTVVGEPALTINDDEDLNIVNNIFVTENDFAFESIDPIDATSLVDYNLYFKSGIGNAFDDGNSTYIDLAAWQAADITRNVNSKEGNPVFVSATDLHVIGGLANNGGDGSVGVTVDFDGDPRSSTTPDIGADEYTPVAGDLALIDGDFIRGICLSTNDSIELMIKNLVAPLDFAVDPLTVTYSVSGPVNTTGTFIINTGTLGILDTVIAYAGNIDLSIPGTYTLNAYIDSNAVNVFNHNDTLGFSVTVEIDSILSVSPKTVTLISATDSAEIKAQSPFFGGGDFFITEVCQFKVTAGSPIGGWPSYLIADDYIEITGVPGSDLSGITLEQWSNSSLMGTYTFPPNTLLSPAGTAIIAVGQLGSSTPSPSDFYYHGNGTYTGSFSSGGDNGRILKDANGNIIDAVGYGDGFSFPASSGVTASDWSGTLPTSTSTSGNRLVGADVNSATNWVVSSSTSTQDPNTVNSGVTVPAPLSVTGFSWSLNGVQVDTMPNIYVGPITTPGTYYYVATFVSPCGTYSDSVEVIVPACLPPSGLSGSAISVTSVGLGWDTTGMGGATYEIQYGPAGFTLGTGTLVTSSTDTVTVTSLANNLCQEYYLRAICSPTDNSPWIGPVNICPEEIPCDTLDQYTVGPIGGQSSLFLEWQGAGGDAEISTVQAASGTKSLRIYDSGPAGFSDVVAYFDTLNTGAWEVEFDYYVPTGKAAYFNIQQNHALNGVGNLWGGEIYFQANGTAEVQYGSNVAGTFTYAQGQWIDISVIIDISNDSVWFEYNGSSTGVGYTYSLANPGNPLQFNGINFYSGVLGSDQADFYMDNFCVTPYFSGTCPAPTALTATNIGCDSAEVSWISATVGAYSIVEYGPVGFAPGTGTIVSSQSPYVIVGLSPGTTYDFYVSDTCTTDTSSIVGPQTFTTLTGPLPHASFVYTVNGFTVDFDATVSTGATTYSWDFGDGNTGSGSINNNTYATGGSFSVVLTVSNACGTDDTTITIASVSIEENPLSRSLMVYPNPSSDVVNISFTLAGSSDVSIRVMDLSGKEVIRMNEEAHDDKYEGTIDVSELADGVYMLEISNGDLKTVTRLIRN